MAELLQQLVTRQAERRPDAIALVMNDERISYAVLEETSNQLARQLQAAGCARGDRVCFLTPKSPAAIISELGILKADCVYVPLDPSNPAPRLAKIIAACEPRCVLVAGSAAESLRGALAEANLSAPPLIGWLDAEAPRAPGLKIGFSHSDLTGFSGAPLDYRSHGADTAHILFTSGSTGAPKGVQITHDNALRFVEWAISYFGVSAGDRISGHPPLHFDLSTFDIYATLGAGAQLHLVPAELSLLPNKIADFIRRHELTQWFSAPSLLNYMAMQDVVAQGDFPALKRLLWCGEVFLDTASYGRIYKTGDLAKVGEDGLVYFLGRADSQIKSRGYRIELGEIETALNALGLLRECAVVAVNSDGFEGTAICCAYAPLPGDGGNPTTLRQALRRALPSYMLPSHWICFERLPQNGNGKIDRRALREQFQQSLSQAAQA